MYGPHVAGTCRVDGCQRDSRSRGWCDAHYRRWERHGDPGPAFIGPAHRYDGLQVEAARVLGIHQSGISRRMRGETAWRVNELDVLARALNVSLDQLLKAEPSTKREDRVSAAPSTGVRRGQTSAGPVPPLEQPSSPSSDLNGRGKRRKKAVS